MSKIIDYYSTLRDITRFKEWYDTMRFEALHDKACVSAKCARTGDYPVYKSFAIDEYDNDMFSSEDEINMYLSLRDRLLYKNRFA